jgi:hypothetical protein
MYPQEIRLESCRARDIDPRRVGMHNIEIQAPVLFLPLTAGLLHPYPGDRTMTQDRLHQLDKLYQSVVATG